MLNKKEIYTVNREEDKVIVYDNGSYESISNDGTPNMGGYSYEYVDIVSAQFNQLKAKLFNLVESVITDKEQKEAVKGLVKDFCNSKYTDTVTDLDWFMYRLGITQDKPNNRLSRGPLE